VSEPSFSTALSLLLDGTPHAVSNRAAHRWVSVPLAANIDPELEHSSLE